MRWRIGGARGTINSYACHVIACWSWTAIRLGDRELELDDHQHLHRFSTHNHLPARKSWLTHESYRDTVFFCLENLRAFTRS